MAWRVKGEEYIRRLLISYLSQYETVGGGMGSEVKGDTTYSTVDDCAD